MSPKNVLVYGSLLQRSTLTVILLCAVASWPFAAALAQDRASARIEVSADSTSWSLAPVSNRLPYLVISSAEPFDNRPQGWSGIARDESLIPSPSTTLPPVALPPSPDHAATMTAPLLLSSALDPAAGIGGLANLRSEPASARQTVLKSPEQADLDALDKPDNTSAAGTFMYAYQANNLPPKQSLAVNDVPAGEIAPAPRPVVQLEIGGWSLPVVLSQTSVSR